MHEDLLWNLVLDKICVHVTMLQFWCFLSSICIPMVHVSFSLLLFNFIIATCNFVQIYEWANEINQILSMINLFVNSGSDKYVTSKENNKDLISYMLRIEEMLDRCKNEEYELVAVITRKFWFGGNTMVHGREFIHPNQVIRGG